nr:nuclear transport factor 2 family protein [uncultured Desulfobulbus sp.]
MVRQQMEKFLARYNDLDANNLEILEEIYSPDIHFVDPAHEIRGLEQLTGYFRELYQGMISICFDFSTPLVVDKRATVRWTMRLRHNSLARGNPVTVEGISQLTFDDGGKVTFHRDYFDLGAMLYEHIPLLGRVIRVIKGRLGR